MKLKTYFSEKKLYNILIFLIFALIFITGIWIKNYFISITILVLYIHLIFRNINMLYSILGVLLLIAGSHPTDNIGFRWGRIYFVPILLIIIIVLMDRVDIRTLKRLFKDKYFILSTVIFAWGILSSILSIESILSLKMTISVFLVFLVFYAIPGCFFTNSEVKKNMTYLIIPLNIILTLISLLNILSFFNVINLKKYFEFWANNSTIFLNPNTFGVRIMLILMLMNISLTMDNNFIDKINKNRFLKIELFFSYIILIINLILSSGRSSILGTAIAFIPMIIKYRKKFVFGVIPIAYFLWQKRNSLYLFTKVFKGTSGRDKIWEYAIKEIIPKNLIIGIGRGSFHDYFGEVFSVKHIHNSYLNVLMSDGIIGLILWLIVLFFIFRSVFMLRKDISIFLFTILGFMAYSFFEIGLFDELGLKMAVFWCIVLFLDKKLDLDSLAY